MHRGTRPFSLVSLLLLISLLIGCEKRVVREYLERAEDKWSKGDYLGAVKELERITEGHRTSPMADVAFFWTGLIFSRHLDEPRRGIEAFRRVVKEYPTSPYVLPSRFQIAEIMERKLNDPDGALEEYDELAGNKDNLEVAEESQYRIGEIYFARGDFPRARMGWSILLLKYPQGKRVEEASFRIGGTYFSEGRCEKAIMAYQDFLERYPTSGARGDAVYRMATCLEEGSKLEEALRLYKEVAGDTPIGTRAREKIRGLEERLGKRVS